MNSKTLFFLLVFLPLFSLRQNEWEMIRIPARLLLPHCMRKIKYILYIDALHIVSLIHGITVQLLVGHVPTVPPQGRCRFDALAATNPAMVWREIKVTNGIGGVKVNVLRGARLDALRNVRDVPFLLAVAQPASKEAVATGPTSPGTLHPVNGKSIANFLRSLVEAVRLGESCSGNGCELVVGVIHDAVAAETRIIVVIGVHIGVIRVCVGVAMIVSSLMVTYSLGIEEMMNLPKFSLVLPTPLLDAVVIIDEALDGV